MTRNRPPAPSSVSDEARAFLDVPYVDQFPDPGLPADDVEGLERAFHDDDQKILAMVQDYLPPADALAREEISIDGVTTHILTPTGVDADERTPVFLDLHGGGFIHGGGDLAWFMSAADAMERPGVTWAPDYRMPPRHPYPAALDDALAAYLRILETTDAANVVISGVSAGGNIAAALALRAKDEGLPMPAALVLQSPELDLTESGDSFTTNDGVDTMTSLMWANELYAGGADLAHPYLSPLFGELAGLPPVFLQVGTRDLFLSNTVRMHRRLLGAGVPAELHVFEAMPHGGFGGASPEDLDVQASKRAFEGRHLNA